MKRRKFIASAAGVVAASPFIFVKNNSLWAGANQSTMTIAYHPNASARTGGDAAGTQLWTYTVNQAAITAMIDRSIMALTGAASVGQAWEQIIRAKVSGLSSTTKIGIKINTAYAHYATWFAEAYPANQRCPYAPRGEVVSAIISGLQQMLSSTYAIQNITVLDREPSYGSLNTGMVANGFPTGGTETAYNVGGSGGQPKYILQPNTVLSTQSFSLGPFGPYGTSVTQQLLQAVADQAVWINLSVPKVNIGAGITASLKNSYGMARDCGETHPQPFEESIIHDCAPRFYQQISSKVPCAVNVLDALAGEYAKHAYYGPTFLSNHIAMSTDPVTIDYYAAELINAARSANGWTTIDTPAYDNNTNSSQRYSFNNNGATFPGTYKTTSGKGEFTNYVNCHSLGVAENIGLGFMNAGNRVLIDASSAQGNPSVRSGENAFGRPVALSKSQSCWRAGIQLDNSGRMHTIESRILDVRGREIRAFSVLKTRQPGAEIAWDGKNAIGSTVANGLYSWETKIDGSVYTQSVHF